MLELSMLPSGIHASCNAADEFAPEGGSVLDRPSVAIELKAGRRVGSVTAHCGKAVFPSPADVLGAQRIDPGSGPGAGYPSSGHLLSSCAVTP